MNAEKLMGKLNEISQFLVDEFPGATVSGASVFAMISDDSFVYPLICGPNAEQLERFDEYGRRVMAQTLRDAADRWEPK